jgi:hypothetical protein
MKYRLIFVVTFMCSALFGGTAAIAQDMRIPAHLCEIISGADRLAIKKPGLALFPAGHQRQPESRETFLSPQRNAREMQP